MKPILELKNVTKRYIGFTLDRVSFALEPGYIMGFIGPNGAGKTTTIKLIMNLIRPDEGEIKIFGLDHRRHEQEIKQRIGFVYDESNFYDTLTTTEMTKVITFVKNPLGRLPHTRRSSAAGSQESLSSPGA